MISSLDRIFIIEGENMEKVDFSKLTGDLVTRENIEYEKSIESWNRAIKKYPLGIVFCNNIDDVKNALELDVIIMKDTP